jgi:hypothetical protein
MEIGLLVLEKKVFKNVQCIFTLNYLSLEKDNPLHLNTLNPLPPRMISAKSG